MQYVCRYVCVYGRRTDAAARYGYEGYQSAYAAYINGSGVCRCIFTAKGKHTGSKGSAPVHDSRHQSGKCFRYRNRAGRKNLTQRYFSKGTGDPGSSCSKWPDGCSKGRRQCSPWRKHRRGICKSGGFCWKRIRRKEKPVLKRQKRTGKIHWTAFCYKRRRTGRDRCQYR